MLEILLVSGDAESSAVACARMRRDGHQAFAAGGVGEAIQRLAHQAVDAVALDVPSDRLPGRDDLARLAANGAVVVALVDPDRAAHAAEELLPLGIEYVVREAGGGHWDRLDQVVRDAHLRRSGAATASGSGGPARTQGAAVRGMVFSRVMAGLAHDLNNALSGVMGYASLLTRRLGADHPDAGFVESIAAAAEDAAALTDQALRLVRLASRSGGARLQELFDGLARLLPTALPKALRFEIDLDPSLRPVSMGTGALVDLLLGLCLQAGDLIQGARATLRIRGRNRDTADASAPRVEIELTHEAPASARGASCLARGGIQQASIQFATLRDMAGDAGGELSEETRPGGLRRVLLTLPASSAEA